MLKFCVHEVILKVPEPAPGRTSGQDLVSKTVARAKTDYCCLSYKNGLLLFLLSLPPELREYK